MHINFEKFMVYIVNTKVDGVKIVVLNIAYMHVCVWGGGVYHSYGSC